MTVAVRRRRLRNRLHCAAASASRRFNRAARCVRRAGDATSAALYGGAGVSFRLPDGKPLTFARASFSHF